MHLLLRTILFLFLFVFSSQYAEGESRTPYENQDGKILTDPLLKRQFYIIDSLGNIQTNESDKRMELLIDSLLQINISNKDLEFDLILRKWNLLKRLSRYAEAIDFINKILENQYKNKPELYIALADAYQINNDYSKAIESAQKAIIQFQEIGDFEKVADAINFLISTYGELGMFSEVQKYFNENLSLCEKINYNDGLMVAYLEYGESLVFENPKLSLELLKEGNAIAQSISDEKLCSVSLVLLRFYINNNDEELAKSYIKSYFKRWEGKDKLRDSNVYTLLAHIYSLELKMDSTIYYNTKALEQRILTSNHKMIASSYLNLAGNYLALDQIQKANEYLEKAKETVFKSRDSRMIMVYYQGKVKYFNYIKDYKNAYLFSQEELKLSSKLTDERHKSMLAKLNSSFKIQQKNILLEKELEERKAAARLVVFILITLLLMSAGAYLIYRYKKQNFSYLRLEKKTSSIEKKLTISDKERQKFQSFFEYSVTGILILDKDGIIQYGNKKSKALLGQSSYEKFKQISFAEFFDDKYKTTVQNSIYNAFIKLQRNEGFKVQTIHQKNFQWLDISFAPLYFTEEENSIIVSLIDITQEVINIEKEQEQKKELQTLLNSVTESILFIQTDGSIKALNNTAANRLDKKIEDVIGSNYFEIVPKSLLEKRKLMFDQVVLSKKPLIETEMEDSYNNLVSMYPNINADGKVDYISEFVQDITERRIAEEEIDRLKQRIFRSQMNPHFIFNSLTSIQAFVLSNNVDSATKYLNSFARLIRLILESSRLDYISLKNEVDILKYYLDIQKMRFADNFNYNFYIDPEIDAERIKVPPMLAQPFIENAIEHGIQHLTVMGELNVKFTQEENFLLFELIDNGIGRAASMKLNKGNVFVPNSLSTHIINERLIAINKYAKEEISYSIIDLKDELDNAIGTQVIIKIPITIF